MGSYTVDPDDIEADYGDLLEWSAEDRDLVTLTEVETVTCSCSGTADTNEFDTAGWTTSADYYIDIVVAPGSRHNGTYQDTKYRLEHTIGWGYNYAMDLTGFVKITGLQIQVTSTTASGHMIALTGGNDKTFQQCIIKGVLSSAATCQVFRMPWLSGPTGNVYIYNNIIYDVVNSTNACTVVYANNDWTCYVYNNTMYNCRSGIEENAGVVTAYNNIYDGNGISGAVGYSSVTTEDYNISSEVESLGAHSYSETTCTYIGAGSTPRNLHLDTSDEAAIDKGDDLSGTFTVDIDGDTRVGWDIGADEAVDGPAETITIDKWYVQHHNPKEPKFEVIPY